MLLTVALVMAAMVLAMALPAFAVGPIDRKNESAPNCRNGNTAAFYSPAGNENAIADPESAIRSVRATASLLDAYVRCGGELTTSPGQFE